MQIVLTLGGMKACVDDVRFLANQSSGKLGWAILDAFQDHGIAVRALCGWTEGRIDKALSVTPFHEILYTPTYEEMKSVLLESPARLGVFSAAVLDFLPAKREGKIKTSNESFQLLCKPTEKLIDLYWRRFCDTRLVAFKLEANVSETQLIERAIKSNADRPVLWIIANRMEDIGPEKYRGFLINLHGGMNKGSVSEFLSREAIAEALVSRILNSNIIAYQ